MAVKSLFDYETDLDTLFATLRNPDYLLKKYDALGIKHSEIVREEKTDGTHKILVKLVSSTNMPKAARKIIPSEVTLLGTVIWTLDDSETKKGHYLTEFEGFPLKISTDVTLSPLNKKSSQYYLKTTARCGIPFIGKLISTFVEKDTAKTLEKEGAFLKEYLQGM